MSSTELEQVLDYLSNRIVEYVKFAESPNGTVAKFHDPKELASENIANASITTSGQGIEGLKRSTEWLLDNSVVTWHKAFLEKLYAGTNPVGVASDMLLSVLNTNSHVFSASPALTVIEKYVGRKYAEKFGYRGPRAGGLTFPGGSYSNMTSMQMARSILFPETKESGSYNGPKLAIFASSHCHYSITKSAIMLGLGSQSVFKVEVDSEGAMSVRSLERQIEKAKELGFTPFYINATAGTTVYGSFDPFFEISAIAKDNRMWLHIDGSWGGNVVFSPKQRAAKLKGSDCADSITVNPHKMLGVPCTCSFLLVPDTKVFQDANSLAAGYLFHSNGPEDDTQDEDDNNFDLADGTMGCGRRADAVKLYLAWQYYGTEGFAERIDHAFEMTAYLANKVANNEHLSLLSVNPPPCLQCCFWYDPQRDLTPDQRTKFTRRIATELHKKQKFLIDYAPHEKGEFFRVVLNSPSVDKSLVDDLVEAIVQEGNSLNNLNSLE